jgi:GT2 family glycosyltransferase
MSTVKLVAVNYKTYDLINRLIRSFNEYGQENQSLLIIDNEWTQEIDHPHVLKTKANLGYAGACNMGAMMTTHDYIGFLNSDVALVDPDSVNTIIEYMDKNPDVAAAGPLQYDENMRVTHAGIYGSYLNQVHVGWKKPAYTGWDVNDDSVTTVSGSALFVRTSAYNEIAACPFMKKMYGTSVSGFPPFPHFYEDLHLCAHLRAHGHKLAYVGKAEMIHSWHKSSPVGSQVENLKVGKQGFIDFCQEHGIEYD